MVKVSKEFKLISAIAVISVIISFIVNGSIQAETLVTTFSVFMGSLYGAALIMIYNTDNKYISKFYKYLTVGFSGSAILTISFILLFKQGFSSIKVLNMLGKMFYITSFYQPCTLIFSFKNQDKEINYQRLILINIVFVLTSLAISCSDKIAFFNNVKALEVSINRDIVILLLASCYVYAGYLANSKKSNKNIEKRILFYINNYIISRVFMLIVIIGTNPSKSTLRILFMYLLILIGDYFMVKILVSKIICQPEQIIYKELLDKSNSLKETVIELSKAKKDIEDNAEKSLKVINNIPVGILVLNDSKISFANEELLKMFNIVDKRVLIGKKLTDLIENSNKDFNMAMYHDKKIEKLNFSFNNVKLICSLHLVKVETLGGDDHIAIVENLSAKISIQKLHDQMERHKEQEVVKDDFLANLSHEFKTPINVIYSAIQMEDLSKRTGNISAITKYNDIIKKNCYRLIKLINNFIDTTRLQQRTIKTSFKPINIVSLVEDTTMSVISYAENKGLTMTFDTDNEEIYVNADNLLIERVVLNLISNAIKYNKDNGHIDVLIETNENEACVKVKDTGIGISKEHQNRMFNRYERLDKKLAREKEGSGLGLNIVKEIIDLHKGRIEVISEEGGGTTISFSLPILKEGEFSHDYNDTSNCEIDSKLKYTAEVEMSDIME